MEWHFSDKGWHCPEHNRFHWYEAEYFRVRVEDIEMIETAENFMTVGILRERENRPRPVLLGPVDPEQEGYIWVTDVKDGEWVALIDAEDAIWARPVIVKKHEHGKQNYWHFSSKK